MHRVARLAPYLLVVIFSVAFILLQSPEISGGFVLNSLKDDQRQPTEIIVADGRGLNINFCSDVGLSYYGYPFRMNGYDYCEQGGFRIIPALLNLMVYLTVSILIFKLSKRLLGNNGT